MTLKRASLAEFLLLVAGLSAPAVVHAQGAQIEERIAASFVLALGRTPTAAETVQWAKDGPLTVADLVSRHREHLRNDAAAARAVATRAAQDALGVVAAQDDFTSVSKGETYVELMQRHIQRLGGNPAEYEQVMHRAYRLHLQRDAYAVELEYWRTRPVLPFVMLVGCVENWARRNQPGLMATSGVPSVSVNSAYLAVVRLSPAVAAEARAAAGLRPPGGAALAAALGRHVVAPGAGTLASVGGIHFAAAGGTLHGGTPDRCGDDETRIETRAVAGQSQAAGRPSARTGATSPAAACREPLSSGRFPRAAGMAVPVAADRLRARRRHDGVPVPGVRRRPPPQPRRHGGFVARGLHLAR